MTPQSQSLKDKLSAGERERLSGLLKTAQAELLHLQQTDQLRSQHHAGQYD